MTTASNLDALTDEELRALLSDQLADMQKRYARLSLQARPLRRTGSISAALILEEQMDEIYQDMLAELRW